MESREEIENRLRSMRVNVNEAYRPEYLQSFHPRTSDTVNGWREVKLRRLKNVQVLEL